MSPAAEGADAPVRVAFLGPAGTFTEQALLSSARPGAVEPVPESGIVEAVRALQEGAAAFAIVPIENSLEGSINVTLDLLAGDARDITIVGEAVLGVSHCLIASREVELERIALVLTHPQVPGQCRSFLRGELAGAEVLPAASTAEAVRSVVERGEDGVAAIGTELAAEIYGGAILRRRIEDRHDNETRFAWLARAGGDPRTPPLREERLTGTWRCSIVFWGAGASHPGWLLRCLDAFARREINLTKIESRPRRRQLGSYMFFADLDAEPGSVALDQALAELREVAEEVRVLGSYRAAAAAGDANGG